MDSVDKRLLYVLAENARMPVKTVAAAAGVSREVADYRIKRLEKRGVIRGYKASLQPAKYFMLINSKDHVLNRLRNKKYPHWIGGASGSYGALLSFSSDPDETIADVSDTIDIKRHQILTVIHEYADSQATLFGEPKPSLKIVSKLDDVDQKIVDILKKDARSTNADIGKKVGLTAEAVRYRIQKLQGIQYRTIIDVSKLNFKEYFVLLNFPSMGAELGASIYHYFSHSKNTLYAARTVGVYSVVARMFAKDDFEFNKIIDELKLEFDLDSLEIMPLLESEIF